MAQQKKRIFWIGFARICVKASSCPEYTANENGNRGRQKTAQQRTSALLGAQAHFSFPFAVSRYITPQTAKNAPHLQSIVWYPRAVGFPVQSPDLMLYQIRGFFYPPGKAAAPGIFPEALQYLFRLRRFRCDIAAAGGIFSTARWHMAAAHLLCPAKKSFYVLFVVS